MKFNFNTAPQWGALGRSKNCSKNTVCGMRLGPGFFRMIQLGWPWLLVTFSQFHWLIFIERERVAWSAPLKRSCRAEWQKRFSYLFDVVLNIWMPCRSMSCQSHISSAPTNEPALTIRHRCRDSTFPDDAILTICTFLVFFSWFCSFPFFSLCQPHEFHPSTWRHRPITTESSDENQPPQNFWKSDEKREKLLLRNFLESIFSFFGGKTRISHGDQVMVAFETKWVIDDSHLTTLNICKYLERALTAANLIHFKC